MSLQPHQCGRHYGTVTLIVRAFSIGSAHELSSAERGSLDREGLSQGGWGDAAQDLDFSTDAYWPGNLEGIQSSLPTSVACPIKVNRACLGKLLRRVVEDGSLKLGSKEFI